MHPGSSALLQTAQPSSTRIPDPQQPGFWSTVFGNQPYGMNPAQGAPPFTFGTGSSASMPPYTSGTTTSTALPFGAYNTVQHIQRPQRQQSGQSSNGQKESGSNPGHSTSPELYNGKVNTGRHSGGPEERLKKTRKRQQTSCSECHRRKQKCNQVR